MALSNQELVQKALIATDALAAAGKLNPAQADKFIDYVIDETVLKNNARTVRFRNEQLDIDKIGIGRRATLPAAEGADPGLRRGIQTSKVTLQPKEIMTPFEITDNFKEINIEGAKVEDHIIKMMATQMANDIEELYLLGDTVGPAMTEEEWKEGGSSTHYVSDRYLAMADGWSKLAGSGHVVDAAGANIGLSIFGSAVRAMPTKFRRNKSALRFFCSPDLAQLYYEKLTTRATVLGDQAAGGAQQMPYGIKLVEVPLWDHQPKTVEHVTLAASATVALSFAPVSSVVVTTSTLGANPEVAFVEDIDYSIDYSAGTITNLDNNIGDGDTVKVTYLANPQLILTHMSNFIVGIGRDITIEKDRDIFKRANQYAIHAKVSVNFEEDDAIVKVKNIGTGV